MKNSGVPRSAFSPKVQAQIAAALGEVAPGYAVRDVTLWAPSAQGKTEAKPLSMIRQRMGPALNKTEEAFRLYLAGRFPRRPARVQDVTLRIGNGCRYTPDFFLDPVLPTTDVDPEQAYAFEVKGFMRDDAAVKLKVAARAFPWIRFFLASRKGRAHPWRIVRVEP